MDLTYIISEISQLWNGSIVGKESKNKRVDICICITDSLCYKAETNTPL